VIAVGVAGHATNGYAMRFGDKQREFIANFDDYFAKNKLLEKWRSECNFYDLASYYGVEAIASECYEKSPDKVKTVFLWGDSHANQLYPGLKDNLPDDWQILQVTSSGCAPWIVRADSDVNFCQRANWFALEQICKTRPNVVVLAQSIGHNLSI